MKRFVFFICIILLAACIQSPHPEDVVIVEGNIEIPIDGCIEAQKKIMGNSIDAVVFCKCLIPEMYAECKNDSRKLKLLKEGKIDKVLGNNFELLSKIYDNCITQSATNDSLTRMTITPRMAEKMRQGMRKYFAGTDMEQTNDIDKYCDCIINGMQNDFTAREIMQEDFNQTERYQQLTQHCLETTKK